ncbi:hypothetical protein ACU4GD_35455 [Cupriavidus basilensis]
MLEDLRDESLRFVVVADLDVHTATPGRRGLSVGAAQGRHDARAGARGDRACRPTSPTT